MLNLSTIALFLALHGTPNIAAEQFGDGVPENDEDEEFQTVENLDVEGSPSVNR